MNYIFQALINTGKKMQILKICLEFKDEFLTHLLSSNFQAKFVLHERVCMDPNTVYKVRISTVPYLVSKTGRPKSCQTMIRTPVS